MNKRIINIKVHYGSVSRSERLIADFLADDPSKILPLYISELAKKCGTSEATVVRFARRLGYDGYQSLKIAIAQGSHDRPVNENITDEDSPSEIFAKVCDDIYYSLEKTKKAIDPLALKRCCELISDADNIVIIGLGSSASIAIDVSHKLLRLGLNAHSYTDNHMQAIAAAHTGQRSVVIGISHSGASKDIIDAMGIAHSYGATTVAITNNQRSPIEKVSDVVLHTVSDETNYRILGLSSRIAQLAIFDAIYSYLTCHLTGSHEMIAKTETALETKKSRK